MSLFLNRRIPLDPVVKSINTKESVHYYACRATVVLDISDGIGGRKDLTIEYPTQSGKHLICLMKYKDTGKEVDHFDMMEINAVVRSAVESGNL